MGQAFDGEGNVLGEAFGDTKSEVLAKLEAAHKDAAEIRIREVLKAADDPLLQFFQYAHLPAHLQAVSEPFGELADHIIGSLPRNPERTVALRKLLEAKDCAVRALIFK
jgi:hypothetical protein